MESARLFRVTIDPDACDGCGICIFECGARVFVWDAEADAVVPENESECVECFICEIKCPHGAIKLTLRDDATDGRALTRGA